VKNKAIQLQEAEGLKESLEEEILNIRMLWIKIARNFGAFRRGVGATNIGDFKDALDHILRDIKPAQRSSVSGFIRFIQNMEQVLPGYDWINVAAPKAELDQFLNFIADLITDFQAELEFDKRSPYNKDVENKSKNLDALESNTENVARAIKQISSILNTVKSLMKKTELESLSSLNRVQ
jgi:archaellum component FlaC